MKKAVAIPYIIALIIGVIVVAVLGYWFISSGSKGINVNKEAECTARKTEFCTTKSTESKDKASLACPSGWDATDKITEFCRALIPNWSPT